MRERFFAEQGEYLPDDLCPFIADLPVRWTIDSIGDESCPVIDSRLLEKVSPHSHLIYLLIDVHIPGQKAQRSVDQAAARSRE